MIPSFINRKHGREPIEYDHPWMKDILAETYGIMVYQEQVMQIASKLARYSLGEGDVLRRAMGKKDMRPNGASSGKNSVKALLKMASMKKCRCASSIKWKNLPPMDSISPMLPPMAIFPMSPPI